jgi:S-DNA-T family DNA segregation ATPase FtsK/SpoIIIE
MAATEVGGLPWHRPVRAWPLLPAEQPIRVPALPTPPDNGQGGAWQTLLPLVGSLSILAFAFIVRSVVYLVVALVLVMAMGGVTIGSRVAQRRAARRRWAAQRERYLGVVHDAKARSLAAATAQRDGLLGLYPHPDDLSGVLDAGGCFERRPADRDFGDVRLGLAAVPASAPVVVDGGATGVAPVDTDLEAEVADVVRETANVADAPVIVPLVSAGTVGVVGPPEQVRGLVTGWVASLAAFHAPNDLRVLALFPPEAAPAWEWAKWLPHTRDPLSGDGFGRIQRTVTSDPARFLAMVEALVRTRREQVRRLADATGPAARPVAEHVLVVVDGWSAAAVAGTVLGEELDDPAALGISLVVLAPDRSELPASTGAWVECDRRERSSYRVAGPDGSFIADVRTDLPDPARLIGLARRLAPLRPAGAEAGADLVDTVRLVNLLGLDHAGALDTAAAWLTPADVTGPAGPDDEPGPRPGAERLLTAAIGVGADGRPLVLDLKESAAGGMGPHGVLVGATGSGKSELLRTLTVALAATHHPDLLALTLVDFKGGAAFAGLDRLPHVAGVITNLADDLTLIGRVRAALTGELERRQELFSAAGDKVDSIGAYLKVAAERGLERLPYLVVVVDEFGELLAAEPDFLDTFVTIGRLGRSLGVHLLLATQRLDEGRIRRLEPHLRYRLALRTFSAPESQAVLGNAAAYELPPLPGLGYLKVDSWQTRFKAALVSTPHRPPAAPRIDQLSGSDVVRRFRIVEPDVERAQPRNEPEAADQSDQDVLVEGMRTSGRGPVHQVWLPPLPPVFSLGELTSRLPDRIRPLALPIGLLDLPHRQAQEPFVVDLSGAGGNVAVVGSPRSGKTTTLLTLVAALACLHPADQVHVYVLDLAASGLHVLDDLPHVGAVVGRHQPETMARVVRELRALLDDRAAMMRQYGVSSMSALRTRLDAEPGADRLADVVLVVDGIGLIRANHPELELDLTELAATGLQYGVHLVVSAARWLDIRPALLDALGTRIELRLNDPVDSHVGRVAAAGVPVDAPGRGLTREGHQVQIAWPSLVPILDLTRLDAGLGQLIRTVRDQEGFTGAPVIAPLPLRLPETALPATPPGTLRLGLQEYRSAPVAFDLVAPGAHLYVAGDEGSGRTTLLRRVLGELARLGDAVNVSVVDPARGLLDLADGPQVGSYVFTAPAAADLAVRLSKQLEERLPSDGLTAAQLRAGRWWSGPDHVLVVDDFEMLLGQSGGPFGALLDALTFARDVGLHVVLARSVTGGQRTSFEPFSLRVRESATALVLSGPPQEGPVVGDVTAQRQPPGRGVLVRRGQRPVVLQCAEHA